jgi:hypothetical protein
MWYRRAAADNHSDARTALKRLRGEVRHHKGHRCNLSTSIILIAVLTAPAFAQSDPFQSNPGPAAPAALAAPKPAARAIRPPPEPEPAQPPPTPVVVPPPPLAPSTSTTNFDGKWVGTYTCGPSSRGDPGFVHAKQATVHEGHMESMAGLQGQPGSLHLSGTIGTTGAITLIGEGNAFSPGVRGARFTALLNGSFQSAVSFKAHGLNGDRTCDLVLGRVGD